MMENFATEAIKYVVKHPQSRKHITCQICGYGKWDKSHKKRAIEHIIKYHLNPFSKEKTDPVYPTTPVPIAPAVPISYHAAVLEANEETFLSLINPSAPNRQLECFYEGCGKTFFSTSELNRHERTHSARSSMTLKSCVVDEDGDFYLVRVTGKGQDFKVHVRLNPPLCSNRACNSFRDDGSQLICRHIRSAMSSEKSECEYYTLNDDMFEGLPFSDEVVADLKLLQEEAEFCLRPFIAESSETKATSRHFSVFVSESERAYVRMTVTNGDRHNWKCDFCPKEIGGNCVHVHACMVVFYATSAG